MQIKSLVNTEHCNNKNYYLQISLFLYSQFIRLIALTLLEPSTSLILHYPFPPLLCHWTLAQGFATPLQALSLVSTRILTIRWTHPVLSWEDSLTICWLLSVLPWDGSLATCSLPHRGMAPSPSAAHSLRLREGTPSSLSTDCLLSHCEMAPLPSTHCLTMQWLPRHPLSRLENIPLLPACSLSPWDKSPQVRLPVGKLFRYPLVACCIAVLLVCLHMETPPLQWGELHG